MLSAKRHSARAGFTIMEILVVLALLGGIAALAVPRVSDYLVKGRAAALAQNLDAVAKALMAFRADVGRYPQQLVSLTEPLTISTLDVCSTASVPRVIPELNRKAWRGPYLVRNLTSAGIVTGSATIQNTVRRVPTDPTQFAALYVDVEGVDRKIAEDLEGAIDGPVNATFTGATTGNIRWVEVGTGSRRGTLSYGIPLTGC